MSKLCDCEYRYSRAASMASEPTKEKKKYFTAAYARRSRPQAPINRNSGISVASKKTKNSMPSSDVNTPCMQPDSTRNAPKYWASRTLIDSHDAITMITVVIAVNTTNHSEMPSTPRCHRMPNDGSHGTFSTNCIVVSLLLKPATSGVAGKTPAGAPASASQRVRPGARSEPAHKTTRPAAMGTQIKRLRSEESC